MNIREELKSLSLPVKVESGVEASDLGTIVFDAALTSKDRIAVRKILENHGMMVTLWRKNFTANIPDGVVEYTLTERFKEIPLLARKLAALTKDTYLLTADENIVPLLLALNKVGYRTIDYSCQGGKGHDFMMGMVVLDAKTLRSSRDLEHVKQLIRRFTPISFEIRKQGRSHDLYLPSGEETGTSITPGSYVVWFSEAIK